MIKGETALQTKQHMQRQRVHDTVKKRQPTQEAGVTCLSRLGRQKRPSHRMCCRSLNFILKSMESDGGVLSKVAMCRDQSLNCYTNHYNIFVNCVVTSAGLPIHVC